MNRKFITLVAASAAVMATVAIVGAQAPTATDSGGSSYRHHRWGNRNSLERMTKTLELTPDQQARIAPILEQTKSQMQSARQEMRQRMKTIWDNNKTQIRTVLTQAQQQKWDAMQKAREDMRRARQAMREAASRDLATTGQ
jgi:Spy/CpxP family protein refolding chaperone